VVVEGVAMTTELPLREGEWVETLPGAPLPDHYYLPCQARGRVVIVDDDSTAEPSEWVTVLFSRSGRPVRLHRRWIRRVSR
jgi:hypothetical protein